ncbi:hypothetical protein [Nocardia sp. NPDC048505]|uniref:hypothetical protein n=1 Tax=unclassified Nocardia TaxID=2637762 RepID=UPI0033C18328
MAPEQSDRMRDLWPGFSSEERRQLLAVNAFGSGSGLDTVPAPAWSPLDPAMADPALGHPGAELPSGFESLDSVLGGNRLGTQPQIGMPTAFPSLVPADPDGEYRRFLDLFQNVVGRGVAIAAAALSPVLSAAIASASVASPAGGGTQNPDPLRVRVPESNSGFGGQITDPGGAQRTSASGGMPILDAITSGWIPSPDFLHGLVPGFSDAVDQSSQLLRGLVDDGLVPPVGQLSQQAYTAPVGDLPAHLPTKTGGSGWGGALASVLAPFVSHPLRTLEAPGPTPLTAETLELPGLALPSVAPYSPAEQIPAQDKGPLGISGADLASGAIAGAINGADEGIFGMIKGGVSGLASTAGGAIGAAIGTAIAPGVGTAIGQALGSLAGSLGADLVLKPIEQGVSYVADTAKELVGSGFGLVDLAKGEGGHTARQDIYNFNGMDPKSVAIATERVHRRRTLAQHRGGGLGR